MSEFHRPSFARRVSDEMKDLFAKKEPLRPMSPETNFAASGPALGHGGERGPWSDDRSHFDRELFEQRRHREKEVKIFNKEPRRQWPG